MTIRRPHPESYLPCPNRSPRAAELGSDSYAVLSEPGFDSQHRVILHICPAVPAQEGLPAGLNLVGMEDAVFACSPKAALSAGIWSGTDGRLWLAWSDGVALHIRRSLAAVTTLSQIRKIDDWEIIVTGLSPGKIPATVHLGSGVLDPTDNSRIFLATWDAETGESTLGAYSRNTETAAFTVSEGILNRGPSLAIDPDGSRLHIVWGSEDLRIQYRCLNTAEFLREQLSTAAATEVWIGCHHPDVACNGQETVISYTDHMQYIKYGWFDGNEWHKDQHLNTLHPRFKETISHSSWLWTDAAAVIHLSFVCLTRCMVYDSRWLGDSFSDPQPVDGLFHPCMYPDDVRVKAERMSVDRLTGAVVLSSSFLPEQHGLYLQEKQIPVQLQCDSPLLFLDLDEIAESRNFTSALVPMQNEPSEPILEPTDKEDDFDGARVLNGGTVLYDEGVYRMWYSAIALNTVETGNWYDYVYLGYAESSDSVNWQRKDTGLNLKFNGKPTHNMIRGVDHNACIFIDPEDKPSRRYKAVKFESRAQRYDHVIATGERGYLGLPRRGWLCTSPDGFAWKREEIEVNFAGPEPYSFTPQKAFHDPADTDPNRRYKAIGWVAMISKRRAATMAYSADCRHWTVAERSPLLDSLSAVTPIRPSGPYSQIHDISMYPLGHYLLAFYGHQFDGSTADIRLALSRDADRFNYIFPETALIANGEPGRWNSGYFQPVDLVQAGDQYAFFYGSSARNAGGGSPDVMQWRVCAGRAAMRKDAFTSLSPKIADQPSTLITVPLEINCNDELQLTVNARLSADSQLRAAVLTTSPLGKCRDGYSFSDCQYVAGDSLEHVLQWTGKGGLDPGIGPFQIALQLRGTTQDAIYSLKLRHASI